ncbi:MAG: Verru_Chthon cassette protein B [Verrucomicrobiota bacterium]|nr:Verru_Chthon cassette protein B [Verrucomicrobiota bacterium]
MDSRIRSETTPGSFHLSGFSLVEVVLAVGIVAFGFVAVLGLLPVGMNVFRQAIDTSVSAQIVQRVVSDAQQTEFDALLNNAETTTGEFYVLPARYFDDQGNEVPVKATNGPGADESTRILYWVRVRGSLPGPADPADSAGPRFTSLPSQKSRFRSRDLSFLTIQIANNPGGAEIDVDPATQLWAAQPGARQFAIQSFSAVIARNGYDLEQP